MYELRTYFEANNYQHSESINLCGCSDFKLFISILSDESL